MSDATTGTPEAREAAQKAAIEAFPADARERGETLVVLADTFADLRGDTCLAKINAELRDAGLAEMTDEEKRVLDLYLGVAYNRRLDDKDDLIGREKTEPTQGASAAAKAAAGPAPRRAEVLDADIDAEPEPKPAGRNRSERSPRSASGPTRPSAPAPPPPPAIVPLRWPLDHDGRGLAELLPLSDPTWVKLRDGIDAQFHRSRTGSDAERARGRHDIAFTSTWLVEPETRERYPSWIRSVAMLYIADKKAGKDLRPDAREYFLVRYGAALPQT